MDAVRCMSCGGQNGMKSGDPSGDGDCAQGSVMDHVRESEMREWRV